MDEDFYPDFDDSDFFTEENMERYFTDSDEQPVRPIKTNQAMYDAGHNGSDF